MTQKRRQYRRDVNCHLLSGRLVEDPVFKYGKKEPHHAVLKFKIATTDAWGNTSYTWVKCFGGYAEMCSKRLVKGTWVLVQGPNYSKMMQYHSGPRRHYFILAQTITFLDGDRPPRKEDQLAEKLREVEHPDIAEVPDYELGL